MRKPIFLFAILSAIVLAGCSSAKTATQIVHDIQRDTVYLSNIQYDSIYVSQDHSMEYHPQSLSPSQTDTIFIKDKSVEYKYRLLRDTTYVHKVDTIPVIKTLTEIQQEKYIPSIYKWSLGIVITLVLILILYIVWKIKF